MRRAFDCPGYRDPLDQMFRNENESTIKKAQRFYQKRNPLEDETDFGSCEVLFAGTPRHTNHLKTSTLIQFQPLVEDVAVANFMSSYVPCSCFDYLPSMYAEVSIGHALHTTVNAVSIAIWSRELLQPRLMDLARISYMRALLDTNAALADPSTAVHDTTLVSVLLLSLFEAITWARAGTPENWETHTRGAISLIRLREPRQFENLNSRKLCLQVASIILIQSIRQKARPLKDLEDLFQMIVSHESDNPRFQLMRLTSQVSDLIADFAAGNMKGEEILDTAYRLDDRYISLADNMPSSWQYWIFTLENPQPDIYGTTVHCYPSHRVAKVWNSYRMIRILLNETIHTHARYTSKYLCERLQAQAVNNIEQLANGICASIPQFTNPSEFCKSSISKNYFFPSKLDSNTRMSSVSTLLWPLSAVRGASLASKHVRSYAVEQLQSLEWISFVSQTEKASRNYNTLEDGLHMFYVS